MGGIKLQLLCSLTIDMAEGSLPYPGHRLGTSRAHFVSPEEGISLALTALDVRQNLSRDTHFPCSGRHPLPKPKSNFKQLEAKEKIYPK